MNNPLLEKEIELMELDMLLYFEYKFRIPKSELFDNEAYYPLYQTKERYNLIYGGRGSAKSYEVCGKMPIVLISCLPFCRVLIVRQIERTHRTSTFLEINDYINRWQLQDQFKVIKSPLEVRYLGGDGTNLISFAGMDKPDSIKSLKDYTHLIFEEAFSINNWQGVNTMQKSIRTPALKVGKPHKIYFVFNPENTNHFLYDVWFDPKEEKAKQYEYYRNKSLILKTTYKDNKFLDQSFIDVLEADKVANPEFYQVDALGNWGVIKETGLFYTYFDYSNMVVEGLKSSVYDPNRPLHISFDFNVSPYVSLEITQLRYNEKLGQVEVCNIDEICLTDKENAGDLQKTVKEFLRRYKDHRGDVLVCGDRAGHSRKTNAIPDFATVFAMLKKTERGEYQKGKDQYGNYVNVNPYPEYEELGCTFKVIDNTIRTQNPRLSLRKAFFERLHQGRLKVLPLDRNYGTINSSGQKRALSEQYANMRIVQRIDAENCKFLIKDYNELKEDILQGGKSTRKHELSHTSDAMDYQICQIFDAELAYMAKEMKFNP